MKQNSSPRIRLAVATGKVFSWVVLLPGDCDVRFKDRLDLCFDLRPRLAFLLAYLRHTVEFALVVSPQTSLVMKPWASPMASPSLLCVDLV